MTSLTPEFRYAGFWKRFNAYGWDCLIVLVLSLLAGWLLGDVAHAQTADDVRALVDAGLLPPGSTPESLLTGEATDGIGGLLQQDTLVALLVSAAYNILFVAGEWQATPGKRWCGIKVVMAGGGKLTLKQSAYRHLASGASMFLGGLGFLTIPFTREKTALHDMICETRVVYTNKERP